MLKIQRHYHVTKWKNKISSVIILSFIKTNISTNSPSFTDDAQVTEEKAQINWRKHCKEDIIQKTVSGESV